MSNGVAEPPDAVQQPDEALGLRLFRPPPEGFDPLQASDRELLVYGYPARPDAQVHPELHDHWRRMMSRPMAVIQPEFADPPIPVRRSRGKYALTAFGWAGSVAIPEPGDQVTFISGQWTVPDVAIPWNEAPFENIYLCAAWIGIDGAPDTNSLDLVQAGTTSWIAPAGNSIFNTGAGPAAFAWGEWLPDNPKSISNFPVSLGDVIYCLICVYSPTEAGVHMLNLTSQILTSFIMTPQNPKEIQVAGVSAEWILENPPKDDGTYEVLPQFGEVYFDNCIAGTREDQLLFAGDGNLQNMPNVNGVTIASPQVVTDRLMTVTYTAPPERTLP
jgi:hypothetical protein